MRHTANSQSNLLHGKRAHKRLVIRDNAARSKIDAIVRESESHVVMTLDPLGPEELSAPPEVRQASSPTTAWKRGGAVGIPPASAWWADARSVRMSRTLRFHTRSAVVGGEDNVRRIWKNLGVTPRCVFAPDDGALPEWMMKVQQGRKPEAKTVIVRSPGAEINRRLLSAEQNDGFAAHFPLPARLPREFAFMSPDEQDQMRQDVVAGSAAAAAAKPQQQQQQMNPTVRLSRVIVAHGLRVPSNVGSLIRTARTAGFDAVVLDRCCDLTSEKVLRAAGEAAFDPNFHIFEFGHKMTAGSSLDSEQRDDATQWAEGVNSALLLKRIAAAHGLLPLMLVPQTPFSSAETGDSYDIFAVAQRYHHAMYLEEHKKSNTNTAETKKQLQMGVMLVVGGEAAGLSGVYSDWNRDALYVPMLPVSIRMDNPQVNSINVAAAGSIAAHLFRPKAAKEFAEYFKRGIVPPQSEAEEHSDACKNVPALEPVVLLESLRAAAGALASAAAAMPKTEKIAE